MARILDAIVEAVASDLQASMAEIARRAGIARATIYVHFPTRESLIDAVTERAIREVNEVIEAADPQRGDAAEALRRVVASAWRTLGRYHSLVALNTRLPQAELHSKHHSVLGTLEPLTKRGQRDGIFRLDGPAAWHVAMILALIHAASAELQAGAYLTNALNPRCSQPSSARSATTRPEAALSSGAIDNDNHARASRRRRSRSGKAACRRGRR